MTLHLVRPHTEPVPIGEHQRDRARNRYVARRPAAHRSLSHVEHGACLKLRQSVVVKGRPEVLGRHAAALMVYRTPARSSRATYASRWASSLAYMLMTPTPAAKALSWSSSAIFTKRPAADRRAMAAKRTAGVLAGKSDMSGSCGHERPSATSSVPDILAGCNHHFQPSAAPGDRLAGDRSARAVPIKSEPTMTPSTDQQEKVDALVAELRSAAEKATPGPWFHCQPYLVLPASQTVHGRVPAERVDYVSTWPDKGTPPGHRTVVPMSHDGPGVRSDDMAYITLANPANILTLLTAFAAEREENERLRGLQDEHDLFDAETDLAFKDLDHKIADQAAQITAQAERIAFLERGIREAQDSLRFNQDDVIWFGGASLETLWEHLESVRDPDGLDPGCPEDDRKAALSADTGSREG